MKATATHLSCLSLVLWWVTATSSIAGGSVQKEKITELLKQNEQIHHLVTATLELDRTGWGLRIGTRINRDLGGARIAPYTIRARPKGSDGPWIYSLEIQADTRFLDDEGRVVALKDATIIEERFEELRVTRADPETENDGADEPATAPESGPEGKERKPEPESEGRPQ